MKDKPPVFSIDAIEGFAFVDWLAKEYKEVLGDITRDDIEMFLFPESNNDSYELFYIEKPWKGEDDKTTTVQNIVNSALIDYYDLNMGDDIHFHIYW